MLDYLVNYGVKKFTFDSQDLDVNDKLMLQDQINQVRRNYASLLELFDSIQSKYLDCSNRLAKKSKDLIAEAQMNGERTNSVFNTNDEYIALEAEQQALKAGMNMVNAQMDYCKNDLRILNSAFYSKF